jgi:predicted metal-dependent phosphoesterase TrpH
MIKFQPMIDLHTHSAASDGDLSPGALIEDAARRGLSALALTDHDTITGLDEAKKAALRAGITFIPGIELQIEWNRQGAGESGGEFHLLGLGIKNPSPAFLEALDELARSRENRNLEIIERMRETGIEVNYDEIQALSGGQSVGRPHFATLLVNRNIAKNREQAFSRYLGQGKLFYASKTGLEFDRAVRIIKESGGIAVLAHPMSLYVAWGRLPGLIKNLQVKGLDGLEAWHPTAKVRSCRRLEELAISLDLYVTAGSDFHGQARPERKLGITAGNRKIEDAVLEAILPLN